MSGENIPIDYLSDRLSNFQVVVSFIPGYGYLGMVKFEETEMYRTGKYWPEAQEAFDKACWWLENHYKDMIDELGK